MIEDTFRKPYEHDESIGMRYINRMAIDEEDQFEIAAIDTLVEDDLEEAEYSDTWYQETIIQDKMNKAIQAAKELDDLRNVDQKEGPNNLYDMIFDTK